MVNDALQHRILQQREVVKICAARTDPEVFAAQK